MAAMAMAEFQGIPPVFRTARHDSLNNPENFMRFAAYLAPFSEHPVLQLRVLHVLQSLPREVQQDFLDDRRFRITLDNYHPERGWSFLMPAPGVGGKGSRCIVLRLKLADASELFAWYVIAHEFAHAYLRNGGWGEITDIEEAADAMAAAWGFRRPESVTGGSTAIQIEPRRQV